MIVKNEAEYLPRCLQSVQGIVDELIVVDTGSVDDSTDIARKFGACVIDFPWQDDFSQARNAGLNYATGYWILVLDADEELDAADREKLLLCAQHTEYDGFFLQVYNEVGDGNQGASINPALRMFRSAPEHRFEGRIHEQIAASICRCKENANFYMSGVKIRHYGYRSDMIAKKNKVNRNMQLLLKTLEEAPNDPFHLYNIGVEYLRSGQLKKALNAFRKARSQISPDLSFTHLLYKCEARCLQVMGNVSEAIGICEDGITLYPSYTDLLHIKGSCEMALGRTDEAKASLFAAYKLGPAPEGFHTEEGIGTYQTCYALGLLHETARDYNAAAGWYLEALRAKPSLNPPLCRLFRFMKLRGSEKELLSLILSRFCIETPEAAVKIITLLLETDCFYTASLLIRQWKPHLPEDICAKISFTCKLLTGDLSGAMRLLTRLRSSNHPQTDCVREWMSFWISWLRSLDKALPFPDNVPPEEIPFAIRIAFASGKPLTALSMMGTWKRLLNIREPWNAQEAQRMIRTAVRLADAHLEQWEGFPELQGLVRSSRLVAPFDEGF